MAGSPDKADVAPEHYSSAMMRWVEMTVALTMIHANEPLDAEERRRRTVEIVGRWKGNRAEGWQPTIGDMDRLIESTMTWANGKIRPTFEGWTR